MKLSPDFVRAENCWSEHAFALVNSMRVSELDLTRRNMDIYRQYQSTLAELCVSRAFGSDILDDNLEVPIVTYLSSEKPNPNSSKRYSFEINYPDFSAHGRHVCNMREETNIINKGIKRKYKVEISLKDPANTLITQEECLHAVDNILRESKGDSSAFGREPLEVRMAIAEGVHASMLIDAVLTLAAKEERKLHLWQKFVDIRSKTHSTPGRLVDRLLNSKLNQRFTHDYINREILEQYIKYRQHEASWSWRDPGQEGASLDENLNSMRARTQMLQYTCMAYGPWTFKMYMDLLECGVVGKDGVTGFVDSAIELGRHWLKVFRENGWEDQLLWHIKKPAKDFDPRELTTSFMPTLFIEQVGVWKNKDWPIFFTRSNLTYSHRDKEERNLQLYQ